jgi:hypothetical protein
MEAKVAAAKQAEAEAEAIVNQAVTEEAQVEEEQRQGKDLTKDAAPGAQAKTRSWFSHLVKGSYALG